MRKNSIEIESALSEYEGPRYWEECYGVDHPDFLPYWIIYMPKDERARYLVEAGREFKDFKTEMLDKDFDWSKWDNTIKIQNNGIQIQNKKQKIGENLP